MQRTNLLKQDNINHSKNREITNQREERKTMTTKYFNRNRMINLPNAELLYTMTAQDRLNAIDIANYRSSNKPSKYTSNDIIIERHSEENRRKDKHNSSTTRWYMDANVDLVSLEDRPYESKTITKRVA